MTTAASFLIPTFEARWNSLHYIPKCLRCDSALSGVLRFVSKPPAFLQSSAVDLFSCQWPFFVGIFFFAFFFFCALTCHYPPRLAGRSCCFAVNDSFFHFFTTPLARAPANMGLCLREFCRPDSLNRGTVQ